MLWQLQRASALTLLSSKRLARYIAVENSGPETHQVVSILLLHEDNVSYCMCQPLKDRKVQAGAPSVHS